MIGILGETKKTIQETIDLNAKIKPSFMQVTVFYPYPGTALGNKCIQEGLIVKNRADSYMEKSILKLPDLTAREIEKAVKNFKYNVYKQYDKTKALAEKRASLKKFIIQNMPLAKAIRPIYRLIKR